MSDNRPGWTKGNLALVGPLAILLAIAGVLIGAHFLGRTAKVDKTVIEETTNAAPLAVAEPTPRVLGKADLLAVAAAAASSYAGGKAVGSPSVVGARFKVELPLGCDGPELVGPSTQVAEVFDPLEKSLRLTAQAAEWSTLPMFAMQSDARIESVEGFWLPRPWTSFEGCPAKAKLALTVSPTPTPAPTLGLAQIFAKDESRVGQRRTRPYELIRKVPEDAPQTIIHPYGFVLEGVIASFPDGKPLRCWSESPDHRPICLFAVHLDHVAFRDPGVDKPLADWPG